MNRSSSFRRGSLMVELLACGALLGVVLSTAIPALRWIVRQRKFSEERQAALLEVENLMERVTTLDWNELTTERAEDFHLSAPLAERLSEPRLAITVDADPDAAAAKIVRINLTWEHAPQRPAPPVRLAAWVYRNNAPGRPKADPTPNH